MSVRLPAIIIVPTKSEVYEGEKTDFQVTVYNGPDFEIYNPEIILNFSGPSETKRLETIEKDEKMVLDMSVPAPTYPGLQSISVTLMYVDPRSPGRSSISSSTVVLVTKGTEHAQAEEMIAKTEKELAEAMIVMMEARLQRRDISQATALLESSRRTLDSARSYLGLNSYILAKNNADLAIELAQRAKKVLTSTQV
ncbi:MAG: hypothetical protein AOA66_0741 [Candidatus Bathyarchaeota archaeon BA2]|nr:MAG: hypothetical protein AOA66_0741 [Candidatus Bathyarchaeota archaeon BA2]